jgi:hypothetical protein
MNVILRRAPAALAVAGAAFLAYFAFFALFSVGFHRVAADHGVGRPMSSGESAVYIAVAIGLAVLAFGLGWVGITRFRGTPPK